MSIQKVYIKGGFMKKYFLSDAVLAIEQETGVMPSQAEIGKALKVGTMAINKRVNNKSEIKVSEVHALQKYFNCHIAHYFGFADAVDILPYKNEEYAHLIKCPYLTNLWNDRELTHLIWQKNESNLRYIVMPGDSMNGGIFPIPNGSLLIIDISNTDILRSGVFAYVTNAGFFVNKIKVRADGQVEFIHSNPTIENREYSQADLQEMGFKVIGRMIKPMNLFDY